MPNIHRNREEDVLIMQSIIMITKCRPPEMKMMNDEIEKVVNAE